jgi:hypothetical protein
MLEVIDREGWRRTHPLEKAIIHIGSAPTNDIVLHLERGAGVSSRHAQLIRLGDSGYRLINLGETDILLTSAGDLPLAPLATADLGPGASLQIGQYTLVIGGGSASYPAFSDAAAFPTGANAASAAAYNPAAGFSGSDRVSQKIGLRLTLDRADLAPHRPIEGAITVRNQGNRPGVQFDIEVENLDPGYYDLGPAPVLFPDAEKDVFLRIYHTQSSTPPAGEFRFSVRATAPAAYPGESAVISQGINILPIYKHSLDVVIYNPSSRPGRFSKSR